MIAICAAICGADSWVDVEMVGKSKKDWLSRLLDLPNGIRSHDIFGRVFTKPDSGQFERCFKERVDTVNEVMEGQVVAIDGKTVSGSHGGTAGKPAIRLVSAWASAKQLILGQVKVTDRSNEITVILEFLNALEVAGCTVTIGAMGCQRDIAKATTEKRADYILPLKQSRRQLYDDRTDTFDQLRRSQFSEIDYGICATYANYSLGQVISSTNTL